MRSIVIIGRFTSTFGNFNLKQLGWSLATSDLTVLVETIIWSILRCKATHYILVVFNSAVFSEWWSWGGYLVQIRQLNSCMKGLLSWSSVSVGLSNLRTSALATHREIASIQLTTYLLLYFGSSSRGPADNCRLSKAVYIWVLRNWCKYLLFFLS